MKPALPLVALSLIGLTAPVCADDPLPSLDASLVYANGDLQLRYWTDWPSTTSYVPYWTTDPVAGEWVPLMYFESGYTTGHPNGDYRWFVLPDLTQAPYNANTQALFFRVEVTVGTAPPLPPPPTYVPPPPPTTEPPPLDTPPDYTPPPR
ncbi:MAG: hypothetical protein Q7P63_04050 [Verrucomicrobiota bacterium JB022]|nr:hypothetical protein [Verrucomicrobiota bacterium JB022]